MQKAMNYQRHVMVQQVEEYYKQQEIAQNGPAPDPGALPPVSVTGAPRDANFIGHRAGVASLGPKPQTMKASIAAKMRTNAGSEGEAENVEGAKTSTSRPNMNKSTSTFVGGVGSLLKLDKGEANSTRENFWNDREKIAAEKRGQYTDSEASESNYNYNGEGDRSRSSSSTTFAKKSKPVNKPGGDVEDDIDPERAVTPKAARRPAPPTTTATTLGTRTTALLPKTNPSTTSSGQSVGPSSVGLGIVGGGAIAGRVGNNSFGNLGLGTIGLGGGSSVAVGGASPASISAGSTSTSNANAMMNTSTNAMMNRTLTTKSVTFAPATPAALAESLPSEAGGGERWRLSLKQQRERRLDKPLFRASAKDVDIATSFVGTRWESDMIAKMNNMLEEEED